MLRQIALLAIVLVFASPCFADAGTMKLEDMIVRSQFIVQGKVSNVKVVDGKKLAELEVVRTLKGDPGVKKLFYWACPTWVCDVSGATLNEEGIYFLFDLSKEVPENKFYTRFLKRAYPFTKGATIYMLQHSGRGRLRTKYIDGAGYLYVHKFSDVVFPASIEIARRPEPKDPDLGMVRLEDVLSFITNEVKTVDEEYEVLSAVVNEAYLSGDAKSIIITNPTCCKVPDEGRLDPWTTQQLSPLSSDTLDDHAARNKLSLTFAKQFKLKGTYQIVPYDDVKKMFPPGMPEEGWKVFYKKYPGTNGYIRLSRVGFNKARDQAMVSTGWMRGALYGEGHYVVLAKQNGTWKVLTKVGSWMV